MADAHPVLGHLPDRPLDGGFRLDRGLARQAIAERIAAPLNLGLEAAVRGILDAANSTMLGPIRVVSVERGDDPTDFVLVPFGGAGPRHGGALDRLDGQNHIEEPRPGPARSAGNLASGTASTVVNGTTTQDGRRALASSRQLSPVKSASK